MKRRAQRCLPWIPGLLLSWLAVLGLSVPGFGSDPPGRKSVVQAQGGKTPGSSGQGQSPGKEEGQEKGQEPKSKAGKALERFLHGKKGAQGDKEPEAGKKPSEKPQEKPQEKPGPDSGAEKVEQAKPGAAKPGVQREQGEKAGDPRKEAAKGLEKFLHGKGKRRPGTGETTNPGVKKGGPIQTEPDPRELLPPPIELARGLPADSSSPFSGNLSSWYRYRRSRADKDQELITLLALDYGDSEQDLWSAHFLGRTAWDMDGKQSQNVFNGILQTYPDALSGRIYTLYLQGRDLGPFAWLRLGRQEILVTPEPAWIDGIRVETQSVGRARLRAGGYLGRGTRIYASSEDALSAGLDVELEPWLQARMRLDWMYVDQRQPMPLLDDILFGMSYWQGLGEDHRLFARITSIGDRGRDLLLRDTVLIPDWDLQVEVSYIELLTTQRRQVVDFDLFTGAAFEYKPYRQFQLHLDQEVTDHFSMDGGVDLRRLKHSSDKGNFNREYERYFLSASLHQLFRKTTDFSLTLDRFDSGGEKIQELSASCVCRFAPRWEARAGTSYSLYKFDWTTSQEREHVRTYNLGLTWRPDPSWRFRFLYILEDNDIGRFHSLRAAFSWDF